MDIRRSSAGFASAGRSSLLFNEDDFDYALELHPDDEYRQVAEALPDIVDFEDIELFSTEAPEEKENAAFPRSIADSIVNQAPFAPFADIESGVPANSVKPTSPQTPSQRSYRGESDEVTGLGTSTMPAPSSGWIISKGDFRFGMGMLEKHKKWVEKAARRSSIGFHKDHPSSDKEAMDKFLLTMARGVHVRRHQAGHISETVRLFSITGCRTIQWEKPKAVELLAQRKLDGVMQNGSTDAIYVNNYDRSAFDCCIAVCGCGDDLIVGNGKHQEPSTNIMSTSEDNDYAGSGRWFHNIGFKRRGHFNESDIIAVHPAGKSDPTEAGALGTAGLRGSKDISNAELSFSVVIRDHHSRRGYYTLDLECDTLHTYVLLLYGFKLLHEELLNNPPPESESNRHLHRLSALWDTAKTLIQSHYSLTKKNKKASDPISDLFEPSSYIDPLRALRVGGGLLAEGHKSPTTGAGMSIRSASPSAALDPLSPLQEQPKLPPARFLGWNAAGTQIWARLRMAGLEVKCVFSWDLERVILKIKCPTWRLEEMAEQMHLKLKSRDGSLKQFKVSRRDTFVPLGAAGAIFRSSERQQIIDYIIRSKIKDGGAELDENTQLGKYIVQRFPLHMYSRLEDIRHSWVTFWKRERSGQVVQQWSPFSESYGSTYAHTKSALEYFFANLLTQPLDNIAEYFGESIAFYFAYMAFYTRWLVFPSVLGFIVTCFQLHDRRLDHWLCIPFGITVTVWACFMLAFWRQKASALAYRWGVLDYEIEETERPQFKGEYMYDETSGEVRKSYSLWKRVGKYFVSIPILALAILLMLVIMTTVFTTQSRRADEYAQHESTDYTPTFPVHSVATSDGSLDGVSLVSDRVLHSVVRMLTDMTNITVSSSDDSSSWSRPITLHDLGTSSFWSVTFFYPSLYGVLVSMMTIIFDLLAIWLNDFENHRTQTTYMNRLILKVFSFQFVTVFTSLYYYAFFMKDKEGAFMRMSVTIFSLMTVGQWWSVFLDLCLPSVYHQTLLFKMKANYARTNRKIYRAREFNERNSKGNHTQRDQAEEKLDKRHRYLLQAKSKCWEEALYAKYNNFSDYTNMVVQIGFVLCFSSVFPLAPLLALLNNIALIRFNALKICYTRQRPIAQKIGGIGVWEDVLQVMSVGGILTNCAIMGLTSTQLTGHLQSVGKFGLAVILFSYEQVLLFFKYWLHASIPRVPPSVQRAHHRERKSNDRKSILRSKQNNSNKKGGGGGAGGKANKPIRNSSILYTQQSSLDDGDEDNGNGAAVTAGCETEPLMMGEQLDFNATDNAVASDGLYDENQQQEQEQQLQEEWENYEEEEEKMEEKEDSPFQQVMLAAMRTIGLSQQQQQQQQPEVEYGDFDEEEGVIVDEDEADDDAYECEQPPAVAGHYSPVYGVRDSLQMHHQSQSNLQMQPQLKKVQSFCSVSPPRPHTTTTAAAGAAAAELSPSRMKVMFAVEETYSQRDLSPPPYSEYEDEEEQQEEDGYASSSNHYNDSEDVSDLSNSDEGNEAAYHAQELQLLQEQQQQQQMLLMQQAQMARYSPVNVSSVKGASPIVGYVPVVIQQQPRGRHHTPSLLGPTRTPPAAGAVMSPATVGSTAHASALASPPNPWDMTFDQPKQQTTTSSSSGNKKSHRRGSMTHSPQKPPSAVSSPPPQQQQQMRRPSPDKKPIKSQSGVNAAPTAKTGGGGGGGGWFWNRKPASNQLDLAPLQSLAKVKVTAPAAVPTATQKHQQTQRESLNAVRAVHESPSKQHARKQAQITHSGSPRQMEMPRQQSQQHQYIHTGAGAASVPTNVKPVGFSAGVRHLLFPTAPMSPFQFAEQQQHARQEDHCSDENLRHAANTHSAHMGAAVNNGVAPSTPPRTKTHQQQQQQHVPHVSLTPTSQSPTGSPLRSAMAGSRKKSLEAAAVSHGASVTAQRHSGAHIVAHQQSPARSPNNRRGSIVKTPVDPLSRSHNPFDSLIQSASSSAAPITVPPTAATAAVERPPLQQIRPQPSTHVVYPSVQKKQQQAIPNPFSFAGKGHKPERIQFD